MNPREMSAFDRRLGRRGLAAPAAPGPRVDRPLVESLVRLSLEGLERMHDPATETLFTRRFDLSRERCDHLSLRYTVMSSLGIHEAKTAGFPTRLDPRRLLESGLARFAGDDVDHLAMALWSNAVLEAGLEDRILPRLLRSLADDRLVRGAIGRVLAWALIGLTAHAAKDPSDLRVREAARRLRDFAVQRCWCEAGGLFCTHGGAGGFGRTQALFSTEIYWVYALAFHGRACGDGEAVRVAGRCADTLVARRDAFGGWPWRFDARTGRVTERFPVYSVHQDAMAPMALFRLSEADGRDVRPVVRESLAWLWRNQLEARMVDEERKVIYRGIRRVSPVSRLFNAGGRLAARAGLQGGGELPWFLTVNATCRPYHLGWLLHAFAGRLGAVEG